MFSENRSLQAWVKLCLQNWVQYLVWWSRLKEQSYRYAHQCTPSQWQRHAASYRQPLNIFCITAIIISTFRFVQHLKISVYIFKLKFMVELWNSFACLYLVWLLCFYAVVIWYITYIEAMNLPVTFWHFMFQTSL